MAMSVIKTTNEGSSSSFLNNMPSGTPFSVLSPSATSEASHSSAVTSVSAMDAPSHLLLLPFFFFLSSINASSPPSSLVITSCAHARYPDLCVHTLTPSAARTPSALAVEAVSAAASYARKATSFIRRLPSPPPAAVRDCAEQLSDSGDQLTRAAAEIRRLRPENSSWQLENALTWASAALTDDDTCLDAVRRLPPSAHRPVTAHVSEARRITCNALYFVSRLAGATPHRRR